VTVTRFRGTRSREAEAVAALGDGLDPDGLLGVVVEGAAQLRDQLRQGVVPHHGVGPEGGSDLLAGDNLVLAAREQEIG
jgi:hypothetical protein